MWRAIIVLATWDIRSKIRKGKKVMQEILTTPIWNGDGKEKHWESYH
jgi:hypothetical protein